MTRIKRPEPYQVIFPTHSQHRSVRSESVQFQISHLHPQVGCRCSSCPAPCSTAQVTHGGVSFRQFADSSTSIIAPRAKVDNVGRSHTQESILTMLPLLYTNSLASPSPRNEKRIRCDPNPKQNQNDTSAQARPRNERGKQGVWCLLWL